MGISQHPARRVSDKLETLDGLPRVRIAFWHNPPTAAMPVISATVRTSPNDSPREEVSAIAAGFAVLDF